MAYSVTVNVDLDRDGSYTGPLATNRISNGDFSAGETGWTFLDGAVHNVSAGKLHLYRNGGSFASAYQDVAYTTNNGDQFTITWKVANPSGASKTYQISLHASTGVAEWINVPYTLAAGAAEASMSLTVSAVLTTPWLTTRFEIYVVSDDNLDGLVFDDISVTTTHAKDDITPYVISATGDRGLWGELAHVATIGQLFLEVSNADRRFSPSYAASPYYGKLLPNTPIQISASDGVTTYTLWTGTVKEIKPQAGSGGQARAIIQCEDVLRTWQRNQIALPLMMGVTATSLITLLAAQVYRGDAWSQTVHIGVQPSDGDTFEIDTVNYGTRTYTFKPTPSAPNHVKISATPAATAAALVTAINTLDTGLTNGEYVTGTAKAIDVTASPTSQGDVYTGGLLTVTASGALLPVGDTDEGVKQRFRVVDGGLFSSATIRFGNDTGSPSGNLNWEITTAGGEQLAYGNFSGAANTTHSLVSDGPDFVLQPAVDYTLRVYRRTVQSGGNTWNIQASTSSVYSDGEIYTWNGSAWVPDLDKDAQFTIYTLAATLTDFTLTAAARGTWANGIAVSRTSLYAILDTPTPGTDGPAGSVTAQDGAQTFDYGGDQWGSGTTDAFNALMDCVESEQGYAYVDGSGALLFKNRYWIFQQSGATPALAVNGQHVTQDGALSDTRIANQIVLTYTPRGLLAAGTVAQSRGTITVPGYAGATSDPRVNKTVAGYVGWNKTTHPQAPIPGDVVVRLPFTSDSGNVIAARDVITPVAGTDYTVNDAPDGSGFDYTASGRILINVTDTASGIELEIKNTASGPLYLFNLTVRGTAIVAFDTQQVIAEDSDSIAAYGTYPLETALPFPSTATFAEAVAYYLLSRYKTPAYTVAEMGWKSDAVGAVNLPSLDIGDVITLTEGQTAISAQRFALWRMKFDIGQGGEWFDLSWGLYPLPVQYAILDSSVLDGGDVLGL